MKAVLLRM